MRPSINVEAVNFSTLCEMQIGYLYGVTIISDTYRELEVTDDPSILLNISFTDNHGLLDQTTD